MNRQDTQPLTDSEAAGPRREPAAGAPLPPLTAGAPLPPPLTRRPAGARTPLSFQQRALLAALERSGFDLPTHNLFLALRVRGPLDTAALLRSLEEVARRHEALRVGFPPEQGTGARRVCVHEAARVGLELKDLRDVPEGEREAEGLRLAAEQARHVFDLSEGGLLRAGLVRAGEDEHHLTVTTHHLVSDGWSLNILLREIWLLYEAFVGGSRTWVRARRRAAPTAARPPAVLLPEPPVQYGDYAHWQQSWPQEFVEGQLSYWRRRLEGYSPMPLAAGARAEAPPPRGGAHQTFTIQAELYDRLRELSRGEGATLYMTLLSAFYVLLYSYTGREDLLVDTPVANRNRVETEGVIGFFANSLFLRTDLSADPSFRELLAETRRVTLEAYDHQDVHFSQVMEAAGVERFQVMFAVEGRGGPLLGRLPGLFVEPLPLEAGNTLRRNVSVRDLSVRLWEFPDRLQGRVSYRTDLFDAETVDRLVSDWNGLLRRVVERPDERVAALRRQAGSRA